MRCSISTCAGVCVRVYACACVCVCVCVLVCTPPPAQRVSRTDLPQQTARSAHRLRAHHQRISGGHTYNLSHRSHADDTHSMTGRERAHSGAEAESTVNIPYKQRALNISYNTAPTYRQYLIQYCAHIPSIFHTLLCPHTVNISNNTVRTCAPSISPACAVNVPFKGTINVKLTSDDIAHAPSRDSAGASSG